MRELYINPFLAGVITTIFVELIMAIAMILRIASEQSRMEYEDETTEETN